MMTQHPFFTKLKNRGLVKISGIERRVFLQGLITNDLSLLDQENYIYACLLTPQGKFLFDFFIREEDESLLLDCEGAERAQELAKILNMYKLRAQAEVTATEQTDVYAVIGTTEGYKDPRHPDIGYRSYSKPGSVDELPFDDWDYLRISLTIPDGSRDLISGKSTMDEAHMDRLNGISYDKGCYVGQELTARMHYRGLGKKHLRTIKASDIALSHFPEHGASIERDDKVIGEMRSSCRDIGIALLKDSFSKTEEN